MYLMVQEPANIVDMVPAMVCSSKKQLEKIIHFTHSLNTFSVKKKIIDIVSIKR
jgi:hypothetical protein